MASQPPRLGAEAPQAAVTLYVVLAAALALSAVQHLRHRAGSKEAGKVPLSL